MSNMVLFNPRPGYTFTVLYLKRNNDTVKRMLNRHTPNRLGSRIWKSMLIPAILIFLSLSSYAQKDTSKMKPVITQGYSFATYDFIDYYGGAYIKVYIESPYKVIVSKLEYTLDDSINYDIEEKHIAHINMQDSSVIVSDTMAVVLNLARRLISTYLETRQLYIDIEELDKDRYEENTNRYQLEIAGRELYNILPKSLQDSKAGRNMANTLARTKKFNRLNTLKWYQLLKK